MDGNATPKQDRREYMKKWREEHKVEYNAKRTEFIDCIPCGTHYQKTNGHRHVKSKVHIKAVELSLAKEEIDKLKRDTNVG